MARKGEQGESSAFSWVIQKDFLLTGFFPPPPAFALREGTFISNRIEAPQFARAPK